MYFIKFVIKSFYARRHIDQHNFSWFTFMSILQKLSSRKTKYYFIKLIMKDESTTSNNIYIINDLFHRQIKFKSDDF